jgi:hypothetical protein
MSVSHPAGLLNGQHEGEGGGKGEGSCARLRPGLVHPLPMMLVREDEPGPADLSGPPRKGEIRAGHIEHDGKRTPIVMAGASRDLTAA